MVDAINEEYQFLGKEKVIAKNVTIGYTEKAIARLREHNPECKIVFVIREPAARAYSSYTMGVRDGWMKYQFNILTEHLKKEDYNHIMYRQFVKLGHYYDQLTLLNKYFPKEQIKIFLFEDLKKNTSKVYEEIYSWLEVDKKFRPHLKTVHNSTVKPKSLWLNGVLNKLRNINNILNNLVRIILPTALMKRMGWALLNLNRSKDKFDKLSDEDGEILNQYYKKEIAQLRNLYRSSIKESFVI